MAVRGRGVFGLVMAAALAAATGAAAGEFEDNMMRLTSAQPPGVASVIRRLVECNRWAHGTDYDLRAWRRASRGVRALRCDTVHQEERALRRRYASNAGALDALSEAHDYRP
jgi:hypothetical protein